ncbi:hypothetical protein ACQEVZ_54920 [Dactylosporangium sp. CA-152071]|uniref:hypothetical protein n=1 Tax=Dactylosporangium sp. CA-152071 TaxID=3239933 RepID=UPI003D8A396B
MAVLVRVCVEQTVGAAPAAARQVAAAIDYSVSFLAVLTVAAAGWWAGYQAQGALTTWIDRRFAAGIRRWQQVPRSRAHDVVFVNAAALLFVRMGNLAFRPVWRRAIGILTAVLLLQLAWSAVAAITAPPMPAAAAAHSAALYGFGHRFGGVASAALFVGIVAMVANLVTSAGLALRRLGRRDSSETD